MGGCGVNASIMFLAAMLLTFARALFPPDRPKPPRVSPPRRSHDLDGDDVGPLDFWLAAPELSQARRDILDGELLEVVRFCGGRGSAIRDLRALDLRPETLAALTIVVSADPRVERIRLKDAPESLPVLAAVRELLERRR